MKGWEEDTDDELLSQETTAPSTWTSARLLLVSMEEAARMASTLISVCVQMDSQVGETQLIRLHLPHQHIHPVSALSRIGVIKI